MKTNLFGSSRQRQPTIGVRGTLTIGVKTTPIEYTYLYKINKESQYYKIVPQEQREQQQQFPPKFGQMPPSPRHGQLLTVANKLHKQQQTICAKSAKSAFQKVKQKEQIQLLHSQTAVIPNEYNTMVESEMKTLVTPYALPRSVSSSLFLLSYNDDLTYLLMKQFEDPRIYLFPSYPFVSSDTVDRRQMSFSVTTSIGMSRMFDFMFTDDIYDHYIIVTDDSKESYDYLQNVLEWLNQHFGEDITAKLIVVKTAEKNEVDDFCNQNNLVHIDKIANIKQTISALSTRMTRSFMFSPLKTESNKKVAIVGDYFVGKSTIFKWLTNKTNTFVDLIRYRHTNRLITKKSFDGTYDVYDIPGNFREEIDFHSKSDQGKKTEDRLLDKTIGFLNEHQLNADVFVVVYDMTRVSTITYAKRLVEQLKKSFPSTCIILIGNKVDLAEEYQLENDNIEFNDVNDMMITKGNVVNKKDIDKLNTRIKFLMEKAHVNVSMFTKKFFKEETMKIIDFYPIMSKESTKVIKLDKTRFMISQPRAKAGSKPLISLLDDLKTIEVIKRKKDVGLALTFYQHDGFCMLFKEEELRRQWEQSIKENLAITSAGKMIGKIIVQRFLCETIDQILKGNKKDLRLNYFMNGINNRLPRYHYAFPEPLQEDIAFVLPDIYSVTERLTERPHVKKHLRKRFVSFSFKKDNP